MGHAAIDAMLASALWGAFAAAGAIALALTTGWVFAWVGQDAENAWKLAATAAGWGTAAWLMRPWAPYER